MRELALCQASLDMGPAGGLEQKALVVSVAKGMAALVQGGIVEAALRSNLQLYELALRSGGDLYALLLEMTKTPDHRDAAVFVMGLVNRSPVDSGLPAEVEDRFYRCEVLSPIAGDVSAQFCVVAAGVLVSLSNLPPFDGALMQLRCAELIDADAGSEFSDEIDHLSMEAHAAQVARRHREKFIDLSPHAFWRNREFAFPHLRFGPDVEGQILILGSEYWGVLARLKSLDAAASDWREQGAAYPNWPCRVTAESESTMLNPRLRAARSFRSASGDAEIFELHARFGKGGRIHMRLLFEVKAIEIGYVGPHLPLA